MADEKSGPEQRGAAQYIVMGRIGAPHGVKGWLKLISFTDPPDNLLAYRRFRISAPDAAGKVGYQFANKFVDKGADFGAPAADAVVSLPEIELDDSRPLGQGFIGHIKGCDVREEARLFTGMDLLVPRSELPVLDEGYYWHQLEGLRVINLADQYLGIVDHMLGTGANDVMVVRGNEESIDQQERLIPWVEDQVVQRVDLEAGYVRVDWEADF